jgi:hypothetical protein
MIGKSVCALAAGSWQCQDAFFMTDRSHAGKPEICRRIICPALIRCRGLPMMMF